MCYIDSMGCPHREDKKCKNCKSKDYYKENKERIAERDKKKAALNPERRMEIFYRSRDKHLSKYLERVAKQKGHPWAPGQHSAVMAMLHAARVCEICEWPFYVTRRPRTVDHDHTTGLVRGILCCTCNTAIGHAKESPALLRALADYLERHAPKS